MKKVSHVNWDSLKSLEPITGELVAIGCSARLAQASDKLIDEFTDGEETTNDCFLELQKEVQTAAEGLRIASWQSDPIINDLLVEIEWLIEDELKDSKSYIVAQVMTYCHLISARLAFLYLKSAMPMDLIWLDPRDIVVTDDEWVSSTIDMHSSRNRRNQLSLDGTIITTYGIGCTMDNENTLTKLNEYWSELID